MEKSEKAKKLREQRKYGKKVRFKTAARFSQSAVFGSWQTWFKISRSTGSNTGDSEQAETEESNADSCKEVSERYIFTRVHH